MKDVIDVRVNDMKNVLVHVMTLTMIIESMAEEYDIEGILKHVPCAIKGFEEVAEIVERVKEIEEAEDKEGE